jgi:hypothetical protein
MGFRFYLDSDRLRKGRAHMLLECAFLQSFLPLMFERKMQQMIHVGAL